ncbi:MAG: hypothetical protein QM736_09285 [Vicinamibacterales bacterium]
MRRTFITASSWTAFIFAIYVFLGFRPAPPQTIGAGEVCYGCRHVITNAKLAAEIMDRNLPTKYRTAGCMAGYVAKHPSKASRYYVTDFVSGGLIRCQARVLRSCRHQRHDQRARLPGVLLPRHGRHRGAGAQREGAALGRPAASRTDHRLTLSGWGVQAPGGS